jgi:hypothetical protein
MMRRNQLKLLETSSRTIYLQEDGAQHSQAANNLPQRSAIAKDPEDQDLLLRNKRERILGRS